MAQLVKEDKVRKIVLLLVLAALFSQGGFLFAQDISSRYEESNYYYFNYTIEKVYTHRLGYLVVYRRASNILSRTYIPLEWFNTIAAKGEIIALGTGAEWPSMIVYYKNGEFSHVRLRLRQNRLHETWGVLPLNANFDDYFKDIEEVKLEF